MKISIQIDAIKRIDLETKKKSVSVGRSQDCDLVVPHTSVSRKHCQIDEVEGRLYITDLGSSNGTFINGKRLTPSEKELLNPSDVFIIGKLESQALLTKPEEFTSSKINAAKVGSNTRTMNVQHFGEAPEVEAPLTRDPPKVKGSRNPVAEDYKLKRRPNNNTRNIYIILFIVVSIIVAALMFIGLNK